GEGCALSYCLKLFLFVFLVFICFFSGRFAVSTDIISNQTMYDSNLTVPKSPEGTTESNQMFRRPFGTLCGVTHYSGALPLPGRLVLTIVFRCLFGTLWSQA
ncbi:MAG: hypothetical protein K6B13_14445, partial [Prevotella sp.]|nr:hypothetical protein [Prevotella sp.]